MTNEDQVSPAADRSTTSNRSDEATKHVQTQPKSEERDSGLLLSTKLVAKKYHNTVYSYSGSNNNNNNNNDNVNKENSDDISKTNNNDNNNPTKPKDVAPNGDDKMVSNEQQSDNNQKRDVVQQQQQQQNQQLTSSSATNLDNQNVIYDNDTTIELIVQPINLIAQNNEQTSQQQQPTPSASSTTSVLMMKPPQTIHDVLDPTSQFSASSTNANGNKFKGSDGFINTDHNDEIEKENYGYCKLNKVGASAGIQHQADSLFFGRLNFWQPIHNGGIMHLVAKIRYTKQTTSIEQPQASSLHNITKRESFRAPIERPPAEGISPEQEASRQKNKHQIWIVPSCQVDSNNDWPRKHLVAELNPPLSGPEFAPIDNNSTSFSNIVNIDAELMVPRYNLTETNEIANKYLMIEMPNGNALACCQVNLTAQAPSPSELETWTSGVSIVQPIRDDFRPERLRESTSQFGRQN